MVDVIYSGGEPRGCPTPGACSCLGVHDRLTAEVERLRTSNDRWRDNMQNAWSALRMIREAIEALGPVASLPSEEGVLVEYGPEPVHEAAAIVEAIGQVAAALAAANAARDEQKRLKEGYYNEAADGWERARKAEARLTAEVAQLRADLATANVAREAANRANDTARAWHLALEARLAAAVKALEELADPWKQGWADGLSRAGVIDKVERVARAALKETGT